MFDILKLKRFSEKRIIIISPTRVTQINSEAMQQLRVSKQFRRHLIFGANTDVGKTIVSAGLVRAAAFKGAMNYNHKDADASQSDYYCHYIKPLQTGVHASWNSSNSNIGNIRNQDGEDGSSDAAFVHRVATALPMPNFGGASKEDAKDYDRIMSLEANKVQCSTLLYSVAQYSTVLYST